jgi:sensor histidine kinase YesM
LNISNSTINILSISSNSVLSQNSNSNNQSGLFISSGTMNSSTLNISSIIINSSPSQSIKLVSNTYNKLLIDGSPGTINQVLSSGGEFGSLSWKNISSLSVYAQGIIVSPGTSGIISFPTGLFNGNTPPSVILTGDTGIGSTLIVQIGLAGINGTSGNWTGANYIASTSGLTSLNWYARQS